VEHRIARLVQLGIRQARYVGRTKTLFQLCLAAAVANLTLLAATSGALSSDQLQAGGRLLVAIRTPLSLIFSLVSTLVMVGDAPFLYRLIRPAVLLIRPLQATSRPAF
jgi:hypothetical protein